MSEERSASGGEEKPCRVLLGKREGKRLLGRPRRGWEDNIKLYFTEITWEWRGLNSSGSGCGHVAGFCEHDDKSSVSTNCGEFLE